MRSLLILALVLSAVPAAAHELLIVQSVRSPMYDEALRGFHGACPAESSTLVLSDYTDPQLARVLREERPQAVVAVGGGAFSSLRKVRKIPVLALMALGVPGQDGNPANLMGVELFVKPEQYLGVFRKIKARRIGVLYDPARTGWYLKLARQAARQYGLELMPREVSSPRQVMGQLSSLKGEIDALWVIPDTTAVTRETLEGYFLFSQGQSIPAVSFTAAHLKLGALATIEADRLELGRQACEVAQQLLRGTQPAELPLSSPRKTMVGINEAVARRLKYPPETVSSITRK